MLVQTFVLELPKAEPGKRSSKLSNNGSGGRLFLPVWVRHVDNSIRLLKAQTSLLVEPVPFEPANPGLLLECLDEVAHFLLEPLYPLVQAHHPLLPIFGGQLLLPHRHRRLVQLRLCCHLLPLLSHHRVSLHNKTKRYHTAQQVSSSKSTIEAPACL
jgi:hypothetical protein